MGNVRFPQYRIKPTKKELTEARLMGFTTGVWASAAIFKDMWEVDDDAVREHIQMAHELLMGYGNGDYDLAKMIKDLEERTGIKFEGFAEG